jgi:hypothetical protein
MAKIDRLGWAAGLSFVSYGLRIGVRVNDPALMSWILPLLPPGWKRSRSSSVDRLFSIRSGGTSSSRSVRRFHLLYENGSQRARTTDLEELLGQFETYLTLHVAERARRRIFVHAGVVGWRGQAIVMPARSFGGKTTLVAALVRAGASYYSDEFAVLDADGQVHPYPRALSVRGEGGERRKYSPEAFGGRSGARPLPVGLVLVTAYQHQARWQPRLLSPGQAVLALLENTVPARSRSTEALTVLERAVTHGTALKGRRGEAEQTAAAVLRRLDG